MLFDVNMSFNIIYIMRSNGYIKKASESHQPFCFALFALTYLLLKNAMFMQRPLTNVSSVNLYALFGA